VGDVDDEDPQPEPFRILVMCTANVCRSPLAAQILTEATRANSELELDITSAGIDAEPGQPMCAQSAERAGDDPGSHRATALTADKLRQADLVLALDRTHRAAAARLDPGCRPRMFTLRQAAEFAARIVDEAAQGRIPEGAPPLPADAKGRLRWLVAELDAARGTLDGRLEGWDDIPDDHGETTHGVTLDHVGMTAHRLAAALATLAAPVPTLA